MQSIAVDLATAKAVYWTYNIEKHYEADITGQEKIKLHKFYPKPILNYKTKCNMHIVCYSLKLYGILAIASNFNGAKFLRAKNKTKLENKVSYFGCY
jgi:hypothetical protein